MDTTEHDTSDLTPALKPSLDRGLAASAAGRVHDLGDFTQYATDDEDEDGAA